jgi:hypothetical protein
MAAHFVSARAAGDILDVLGRRDTRASCENTQPIAY